MTPCDTDPDSKPARAEAALMPKSLKWLLALVGVATLGYAFRGVLLYIAFVIAIPFGIAFSVVRVHYAMGLVEEATQLPPPQAVGRLRELLQEYRYDATSFSAANGYDSGAHVRSRALRAQADYEPQVQAAALPELLRVLSEARDITSGDANAILLDLGGLAEPAIPELLHLIKTSEYRWQNQNAANILRQIAIDLDHEFPQRSVAVDVIDKKLLDPDWRFALPDFVHALTAIDPAGDHCVEYLTQAASSKDDQTQNAALNALRKVAEHNEIAREWLAENTEVDVDAIPRLEAVGQ
jgi:hypothetical protein